MKSNCIKIVLFFAATIIIYILAGLCTSFIAPHSDNVVVLLVNIVMTLTIIGGLLAVILLELMELKK